MWENLNSSLREVNSNSTNREIENSLCSCSNSLCMPVGLENCSPKKLILPHRVSQARQKLSLKLAQQGERKTAEH